MTKRELAIEILGIYENFGCELKKQVFDKVLERLVERRKEALERHLSYIKSQSDRRLAARYSISILTRMVLPA